MNLYFWRSKEPAHPCPRCGKEQVPYKLGTDTAYCCKDPECIIHEGDEDSSLY